jgi:hypothetical protein
MSARDFEEQDQAVVHKNYDKPTPYPGITVPQYLTIDLNQTDNSENMNSDQIDSNKFRCQMLEKKNQNSLSVKILPNGVSLPIPPFSNRQFCDAYPNAYAVDSKDNLWMGVDAAGLANHRPDMD